MKGVLPVEIAGRGFKAVEMLMSCRIREMPEIQAGKLYDRFSVNRRHVNPE